MVFFDRVALLEAELSPQVKYSVEEARRNNSYMELIFWVPLTIDGHPVITQSVMDIGKLPMSTISWLKVSTYVCLKITGTNGRRRKPF